MAEHKQPGAPRLSDGSVNLSASAPRIQGHPDLSGVWQIEPTPVAELTRLFGDYSPLDVPGDHSSDFHKYLFDVLVDYKDKPIRPEGEALFQARVKTDGRDVSTNRCLPAGIPQMHLLPFPVKFVHSAGLTLLLAEMDATTRQIYTDGRKLPVDPNPSWLGYSVGRWEKEVFVVDTLGFHDKTWLDASGRPHSDQLRTEERFFRRDYGHLDVTVTMTDPQYYTRPFSIKFTHKLLPDSDILENVCAENEKDWNHMKP